MAGIVHFANFFRYMEAAETDFLRARGLSVTWRDGGQRFGFPRVSARATSCGRPGSRTCWTIAVTVEEVGRKSVTLPVRLHAQDGDRSRSGGSRRCSAATTPDHGIESLEIPADVRAKLTRRLRSAG